MYCWSVLNQKKKSVYGSLSFWSKNNEKKRPTRFNLIVHLFRLRTILRPYLLSLFSKTCPSMSSLLRNSDTHFFFRLFWLLFFSHISYTFLGKAQNRLNDLQNKRIQLLDQCGSQFGATIINGRVRFGIQVKCLFIFIFNFFFVHSSVHKFDTFISNKNFSRKT